MVEISKEVLLDNGVTVTHHIIDSVQYNGSQDIIQISIASYVNKTAYDTGLNPVKISHFTKLLTSDSKYGFAFQIVDPLLDIEGVPNIVSGGTIIN